MNLVNHINTYQSEADYQNDNSKNFPNVSYIVENDNVLFIKEKTDYSNDYLTFEVVNGGNVTIKASDANVAKTIQYSTDNGSTWTSLTTSTTAQELGGTLSVGDKVLVKGTNTTYGASSDYNSFGGTAKVNVYGNIMSLISGDSFANNKTLTDRYTFRKLFYSYTNLLSAENLILPATTLTNWCYQNMFQGCTGLTTAPELPATTLASGCYYQMFDGTNVLPDCTNIDFTSKAVLDSGGLIGLFAGTKVTDSDLDRLLPKNTNGKYYLPATTLADYCYQRMFQGCTGLTTAPELPATTLADYCYQYMFFACTNLVNAPELPATTLTNWCYGGMFFACTSLTTAPTLPATTLADYCYYTMFYDCSSLNYIKCLATDISANNCTGFWVYSVASSGTFVKAANMERWTTGDNGIPTGWTVVNE